MKGYRPLILSTIDARLPGVRLRHLRLHRHLPEADALEPHSHRFAQVLCYLAGGGTLLASRSEYRVLPGSLALVPSGCIHGFRESGVTRPICLALDFEIGTAPRFAFAHLNGSEGVHLRRHLADISRHQDPAAIHARILVAASALAILDLALRALGVLPREARALPALVRRFNALVRDPGRVGASIAELGSAAGYHPEYLNRCFKKATGLTLRQQRDALRLDAAKRWLAAGAGCAEAGRRIGIDDANYFSRWFKRLAGLPPSRFAGRGGAPSGQPGLLRREPHSA